MLESLYSLQMNFSNSFRNHGGLGAAGREDGRILARSWMSDQCLHSANPLFPLSLPQPGLIQLDQDDTNNWLKLETVCRPNDPYLTLLFCCDAVLFLPAPRSIWSGLPWLCHKCFGPNPPAGRYKCADIMRVMKRLHFLQMSGKLTTLRWLFFPPFFLHGHPILSLFVPSPPRTHKEGKRMRWLV